MIPEIHFSLSKAGDVLSILLGGLGMTAGVLAFWRSWTVQDWIPVEGTVLHSRIKAGEGYFPFVRYRYSFDGRSLEGNSVRFIEKSYNRETSARAVVSKYRPGGPVTVWVNPKNPKAAVLEPVPQPALSLLFLAVGLLFVGIGVYELLG